MMIRKHKLYKRGQYGTISDIIIKILEIVVVIAVVGGLIWGGYRLYLALIADKYQAPELNYDNVFNFHAETAGINNWQEAGCMQSSKSGDTGTYCCPANKDLEFNVHINNQGAKQRKFYASPTFYFGDDAKTKNNLYGSNYCLLSKDESQDCIAGTRQFSYSGTYKAYPGAECDLDITYGCYVAGSTAAVRSDNPQNYLTLIITDKVPTSCP
jgi:hypothetical protein